MSARVFNRFAMSEARAPRGPPPGQEIERARRVLFVDTANGNQAAQARQVAADQLAENIMQKSQQWNFDFGKGVPLNNSNSRLQWQKQETTDRVPRAYSLERLPYLNTHAADSDLSDNEAAASSDDATTRSSSSSRQPTITEFMSKRKSSSSTGCPKPVTSSSSSSTTEPASKKQKTSSS